MATAEEIAEKVELKLKGGFNKNKAPSLEVRVNADDKMPQAEEYMSWVSYGNKTKKQDFDSYKRQLIKYIERVINSKEDMTQRVQLKTLNLFPKNVMGGVLGFTYIGDNFMGRRDDLTGSTGKMVDIHESIHTPDEYETRILTEWILSKEKRKYVK